MKYAVIIINKTTGSVSTMSHKGKLSWSFRTAKKYAAEWNSANTNDTAKVEAANC